LTYLAGTLGKRHSDGHVHRWLDEDFVRATNPRDVPIGALLWEEILNQAAFRRVVAKLRPEIVFVWNPTGISISLVETARRAGIPVCFYVSDDWLERWLKNPDPWFQYWARRPRQVFSRIGMLMAQHVLNSVGVPTSMPAPDGNCLCFASEYLRESAFSSGKLTTNAEVIHHGVDTTLFNCAERRTSNPGRLLYVGQVMPHKGVHTAIQAVRILREQHAAVRLDVVGTGSIPSYAENLRKVVQSQNLQDVVRFCGFVDRTGVVDVYCEHDILVFPSIWDEPFGIVPLEAMASGLPVVGTATGGSAEVLKDEINGLVFQKESAEDCARQVQRLLDDPALYGRLSRNAAQTVQEHFSFEDMADQIERWLLRRLGRQA
jgi:glycosyltransferase involved in cell wall biosynthesis